MAGLTDSIQQTLRRYQRRVRSRFGWRIALGGGCLAVLVWRLHQQGVAGWWLVGGGLIGLGMFVAWQWRSLHAAWLSDQSTALVLDRTLGLQARLVTAAEFATVPNPPLLYPVLVEETQRSLAVTASRLPRLLDRWTGMLTVVLLALLWWPGRASPLQRLAMRPPVSAPPVELPPPPQPPDQPQPATDQHDETQPSASSDEEGSGLGNDTQPSSEGANESSASPSTSDQGADQAGSQDTAHSLDQGNGPHTAGGDHQQPSSDGTHEQMAKTGDPQQSKDGALPQASPTSTAQAKPQQTESAASTSTTQSGAAKSQTGKGQASAQAQSQRQSTKGQAGQMTPGTSQGEAASQELLKADIQQLLKELSQEIESLQQEVAKQQQGQPNPLPGTSTDPELYEAPSSLEPGAGRHIPIQLKTDAKPSASTRPGSGVGKPSGRIASASPAQHPEEAELSEEAEEAGGVSRQPIPPEYRSIFEQLSTAQSSAEETHVP